MQIDSCTLVNLASTCMLYKCFKGKKACIFAKMQAGEVLPGNLMQIMFPVHLSVALPWVLHIILQEDVWRRRPRNTVAIVSHFSFSVLMKERRSNPFPLICLHKCLIHSYKSTFPLGGFSSFSSCTFVFCFFFNPLFHPPPPICQERATFDRCRHGSTGMQYMQNNVKCKCKIPHFVEYSEMTDSAADLLKFFKSC